MYESFLMLDPEANITLEHVAEELRRFYEGKAGRPVSIEVSNSELVLRWPDYSLRLTQSSEPHVLKESSELAIRYAAQHPARERIAQCRTRFEVFGGDDPGMDHFNDYLFVAESTQRLGAVYRFEPASEEFVD